MSNHAVTIFEGKDCGVVGCDMLEMGGGGIYMIGGETRTLTPGGHYAENNHIHHFARWDRMYRPGIWMSGVGLRASHNLIHHAPHAAILYGGQDHLFEYNEIHNVCQESHDCGAIYAGRSWCLQGDVFQYNYMHHLAGKDGGPCNGIYLDDENSGATIRGNVFYQVLRPVFIGGGRDNLVENNLFVDCPQAIHLDARGIGWASYAVQPRIDKAIETGILCGVRFKEPPFSTRYPKLAGMLDDEPAKPKGNIIRRNIFWQGAGVNLKRTGWDKHPPSGGYRNAWWHHIEAKVFDLVAFENNLIDVDPKLASESDGDFQLQRDSPAWEIGFEPIPFHKIGLYRDASRASWPVDHPVTPLPQVHKH
ncbi:right-handed parallel beta-helix repeat-containing protein [Planctomycetales bacterium ZRK34]|nr:right-handed parallel beta-helix repeat-containing protein [Planctomycetales bacterium ZRK34]